MIERFRKPEAANDNERDALARAVVEAKDIWGNATFPERHAAAELAQSLYETLAPETLAKRIMEANDDLRAENNDYFIAASRALLRHSGLSEQDIDTL